MKRRFARLPPLLAAKIEDCGALRTPTGWLLDTDSDCYRIHFGKSPHESPKIARRAEALKPIPREDWPEEIAQIAEAKIDGERGVGDTAARISECQHCAARTARWNIMFPYDKKETP